ncbi:uncharacterized protein LOC124191239 [Daphnia pulex]|uniref:uncharacterized protein LOC124191239 n=1 Tax=Daphnia pulex TaxID=6669 RepID=UPI001EDE245D|nr:uncharacterized protein LOC124191239 [Daphnia pulex]
MNRSALRLHVLCCIGPHLIAAFISLRYDIKSWYDTISATSVVLTTFVVFSTNKFFFRGTTHIACVLLGVVSHEVSRQSRSTDWNRLANPEILGFYLCMAHVTKGIATFIKLMPTASVVSCPSKYVASWRDYVGFSMSIISSCYFLQEPNIYRNEKRMIAWRLTFAKIETLHWAGLALSASTNFERYGWLLILFTSLQSLLAFSFFYQLQKLDPM